VDEENVKEIKPLPNLDYKIVCGNSLLGVKEDLFNNDLFIRLEDLKRRFFNETDSEKKAAYKNQIDGLISDITKGHTRFDFEVWFSEVFHKKGGFDVVIGNPPYVLLQHTNRDANLLTYVKNKYTVASYKIDLYHLFIEKGVLMLKKDGCITYITPSNFSANNYAVKLRRFLLTRTSLKTILFFEDNVFGASVNNLVFVATNSDAEYIQFQSATIADSALSVKQKAKIRQSDLINEKCLLIVPKNSRSSNILKKIERNKIKLGNLASVNFGMQLRDRNKFKDDVIENPTAQSQLNKYHRPCYTGKDIHKYIVLFNNRHCFFNKTAKRGGCWNEAIHNKKEKILIRQVGTFPEGGIDDKGYAVLNTAFMIAPLSNRINSKFLLAIINSNLIKFYWKNTYRDDRNVFPKIKGEYLKLIPIPEISEMCQLPVVKLIDQILAAKKQRPGADTSQLEKQIDQLVYKLYELTPEEINIAEGETG
jgi:hypothetical protein